MPTPSDATCGMCGARNDEHCISDPSRGDGGIPAYPPLTHEHMKACHKVHGHSPMPNWREINGFPRTGVEVF